MKLKTEHIHELLINNRYDVRESKPFISRDFSGDYLNKEGLPALAIPGADIGQLYVLQATANSYGFEINTQKTLEILLKLIGGEEHFSYHTTDKDTNELKHLSCEYVQYIYQNPELFSLTIDNIQILEQQFSSIKSNHTSIFPQKKDVNEGAILIVNGNYSLHPRFVFQMDEGMMTGTVYIFHRTLADKRHRALAQKLIQEDAVKLFDGCDEEYLYTALSETIDTHFFQATQNLLQEVPLYTITFADNGSFDIEQS